MYIVKYSAGSYDDWHEVDLFVTNSKETADKYVERFNNLIPKLKEYNKKFENKKKEWIMKKYWKFYNRWNKINDVNRCYYRELNER